MLNLNKSKIQTHWNKLRGIPLEFDLDKYEKILDKIWRNILGVDNLGIDDNFFELGGDSMLSIQIIARAQQKGVFLTPKQIFESPTIRA